MGLWLEVLLMTIFIMAVSFLHVFIVIMISNSKRPKLYLVIFLFLLTYSFLMLYSMYS